MDKNLIQKMPWSGYTGPLEEPKDIKSNSFVKETPDYLKQAIRKSAIDNGIPTYIFSAMLSHESRGFDPRVISGQIKSPSGAVGIAQLMPRTARWLNTDPTNPLQAIPAAAKYLKNLSDTFGGIENGLKAYNAGEGNMRKYNNNPPFKETQNYVPSIMSKANEAYDEYKQNFSPTWEKIRKKMDAMTFKNMFDTRPVEKPTDPFERITNTLPGQGGGSSEMTSFAPNPVQQVIFTQAPMKADSGFQNPQKSVTSLPGRGGGIEQYTPFVGNAMGRGGGIDIDAFRNPTSAIYGIGGGAPKSSPIRSTPVKSSPIKSTPAKSSPIKSTPAKASTPSRPVVAAAKPVVTKVSTVIKPVATTKTVAVKANPAVGSKQGILPGKPTVTQVFGNYNPNVERMSGGINRGADFSVAKGTPVAVPPGKWKVVEAYSGAKKSFLGNPENRGYGNSVKVQNQATGETMRLSHLSQVNVVPGQVVDGQVVGFSGATGNATGPHLDVEYYNANGRLSDVLKSPYGAYLRGGTFDAGMPSAGQTDNLAQGSSSEGGIQQAVADNSNQYFTQNAYSYPNYKYTAPDYTPIAEKYPQPKQRVPSYYYDAPVSDVISSPRMPVGQVGTADILTADEQQALEEAQKQNDRYTV